MAAISGPPLGAWPVLGRRAHRAADWVAIVALAASPALPGRDAASILAVEAAAVALWRLSSATRFDVAPARVAEPRGPLPEPAPLDPAVDAAIRRQARVAGLTLGIIRRRRRDVRDSRSGS